MSYALAITSLLGSLLTSFTDTERELVCVERVSEYIDGLQHETTTNAITVRLCCYVQKLFKCAAGARRVANKYEHTSSKCNDTV